MSWEEFHKQEQEKDYFKILQAQIDNLYNTEVCYPPKELIYRALKETSLDNVRVVIIGQDPYHGPNQANGLAFAVNEEIPIPPSLRNILKESGSSDRTLLKWANQGVLLLNTVLTVIDGKPLSCSNIPWKTYTTNAIKYLLEHNSNLIFMLWGNSAQSLKPLIYQYKVNKNIILESSHPSPLSAYISFNGSGHFTRINEILKNNGLNIIEWS